MSRPARAEACRRETYEPPEPGISAESSAVTRPSLMARSPPRLQASMPRPPPMAARISGIVMNGPIPTMSIMFRAIQRQRPMSRRSSDMGSGVYRFAGCGTRRLPSAPPLQRRVQPRLRDRLSRVHDQAQRQDSMRTYFGLTLVVIALFVPTLFAQQVPLVFDAALTGANVVGSDGAQNGFANAT